MTTVSFLLVALLNARQDASTPEADRLSSATRVANVGFGPLHLRSQSPLHILRTSFLPNTPSTLMAGEWEFGSLLTWTNRWAFKESEYLVDMEVIRPSLLFKHALTDSLTLQVEVPFLWSTGGGMDGFIEGFHDTFGLGQAGRDKFERDQVRLEITTPDGQKRSYDPSDIYGGLTDVVLSGQYDLTDGTEYWPALALGMNIKLPVGSDSALLGTPGVDPGLYLSASKGIGDWGFVYLNLGGAWLGREELGGLSLKEFEWTTLFAFEWRAGIRFSWIVQLLANSGIASSAGEMSEISTELTLGFKLEFPSLAFPGKKSILEFGLTENLFHFDNSPDFGVHLGFTLRM